MNVNDIIQDEVKKVLTEGVVGGDENFTFVQPIDPSRIALNNFQYFTDDFDVTLIDATIAITWKVGFWVNQNGIENFMLDVVGVEGMFTMELRDKQSDEVVRNEQKNINDVEWKFVVNRDVPLTIGGSFYADGLDFDFNNNVCTVKFV